MAAIIQEFLSWGNSNEYLLAKFGVDTAENEPLDVWGENSIQYHSIVSEERRVAPPAAATIWT